MRTDGNSMLRRKGLSGRAENGGLLEMNHFLKTDLNSPQSHNRLESVRRSLGTPNRHIAESA